jgi:hypothetical protein
VRRYWATARSQVLQVELQRPVQLLRSVRYADGWMEDMNESRWRADLWKPETTLCVRCGEVKCYLPCNVCTLCLMRDPEPREDEV